MRENPILSSSESLAQLEYKCQLKRGKQTILSQTFVSTLAFGFSFFSVKTLSILVSYAESTINLQVDFLNSVQTVVQLHWFVGGTICLSHQWKAGTHYLLQSHLVIFLLIPFNSEVCHVMEKKKMGCKYCFMIASPSISIQLLRLWLTNKEKYTSKWSSRPNALL